MYLGYAETRLLNDGEDVRQHALELLDGIDQEIMDLTQAKITPLEDKRRTLVELIDKVDLTKEIFDGDES